MTKRIFFIIVFICVALEVTFLNYFKIFSVKPDLSLIAVVFASLYFDLKWALILSIFVGLLKDTFSLNPFGIYTPLFALYSLLIARLSRKISLENNLILMVLVFIIVIFNSIIIRFLFVFLHIPLAFGIFLCKTIFGALYTAIILPFVFRCLTPILNKNK